MDAANLLHTVRANAAHPVKRGGSVGGQVWSGGFPRLLRVSDVAAVPDTLNAAALHGPRPVVVLVGGAGGIDEAQQRRVVAVLRDAVVPVLERAPDGRGGRWDRLRCHAG